MIAAALRLGVWLLALWAIQVDIDRAAIEEASSIARDRRGDAVARFHARYIDLLGGPKVKRLEVVTEFRRAVLFAEARLRQGDFTWTASTIERALAPHRGRVSIQIEITFPPLHAFVRVPDYRAALSRDPNAPEIQAASGGIRPLDQRTLPIYPVGGDPDTAMTGTLIEFGFDARSLDPNGRYALIVFEEEARLDPMTIDLSRYR